MKKETERGINSKLKRLGLGKGLHGLGLGKKPRRGINN